MINLFNKLKIGDDLPVSRMGYGAMRITGKDIWGPPKDKQECAKVLKRAIDLGVNFIDTADSYGPYLSEQIIAETLFPYPKDLVIATKGGIIRPGPTIWLNNGSPKHLEKAIEGSLKRLKLDYIDLYQLHRIDQNVSAEFSFEYLAKAQEQGKIKHIGLSEVSINEILLAKQYFKVASVQNIYSVDNRHWETELNFTKENNIVFIPWFPLGGGALRQHNKLETLAQHYHGSVYQIALSWLLNHSPNIITIPGTANVNHLEENMNALNIKLTIKDINFLNTLSNRESKIKTFINFFRGKMSRT